jgi:anti-sigma regulatory factor (Ser/Thr protein kinase)
LVRLDVPSAVIDDAELLVSELVTNAVLHARSASRVDVDRSDGYVRVAVRDDSSEPPLLRDNGADSTTGRGLLLVERVARTWGVDRSSSRGKTVWFELDALDPRNIDPPK